MTATALLIVLVAAFLHAFWNYLAKKSRNKIAFIWWFILFAVVFYFPMFLRFFVVRSFSSKMFYEPFAAIRSPSSIWALMTGCTIAAYSLVDKVGVKSVHPAVYIYFIFLIPLIFLTPYVLAKERATLRPEWQINKGSIMIVGFLVAFTYLLVLFAMQTSNVSYVVAARESSIVFSALFGIIWLGEGHRRPRLIGAFLIACGVIFIGLSQ